MIKNKNKKRRPAPVRAVVTSGINLRGAPPDPATFDGPLNEFIELHGTALAANQAAANKAEYDTNFPDTPPPGAKGAPRPAPMGEPISCGKPVYPDMSKYVTDRAIDRVKVRPHHRANVKSG